MGASQSRPETRNGASEQPLQEKLLISLPAKQSPNTNTNAANGETLSAPKPRIVSSRPVHEVSPSGFPVISSPRQLLGHPTIVFSSYCTTAGLMVGAVTGILRDKPPVISSLASGIQWGIAGGTYHGVRSLAIQRLGNTKESQMPATLVASTAAGAVAGAFNTRRAIMPTALLFGVLGLGTQWLWHKTAGIRNLDNEKYTTWSEWAKRSKYSPVSMIPDEEYKGILQSRLNKVESEIADLENVIKAIKNNGKE